MIHKLAVFTVTILLLFACGRPAWADIRLPPTTPEAGKGAELASWIKLRPYIRLTSYYTSNLLQERNHRSKTIAPPATVGGNENDVVTLLMVGTDLLFEEDESTYLLLGYTGTVVIHAKHPKNNTVEHRTRWQGGLTADRLTLDAGGKADWTVSNSDPQFSGRIRNFRGSANLNARYDFDDVWGTLAAVRFSANENFSRSVAQSNAAEWGGDLYLTLDPNLSVDLHLLAGVGFREIHYFDHKATTPDLSLASAMLGVDLKLADDFSVVFRAGYEVGWVKKRNGFSRQESIADGVRSSLTVAWQATTITTLSAGYDSQIGPSAGGAYQRSSTYFARLDQGLFLELTSFFKASYTFQEPRHQQNLRNQSYRAGVAWARLEYLEVVVEGGYARNNSRRGGYESWNVGIGATLHY